MAKKLETIRSILAAHLPGMKKRYGVKEIGIFGSYAGGLQRKNSDLDILVEFANRPLTLFQILALENELGQLTGIKVDLVEKAALKPYIGRRILNEVIII